MQALIDNLTAVTGANWLYALAAAFVAMICESARPKAEEGKHDNLSLPRFLAMLAGTLTPFLLFLHLVGSAARAGLGSPIASTMAALSSGDWASGAGGAMCVGIAALVGVIAVASILGLIIASATPALGRALQTPGPIISILTFGFTVYVTWTIAWWVMTHPMVVIVRYT